MPLNAYIAIFVFGLCFGSFANVCIYRWANEMSVIKPPSHCPHCQARLSALDLIPVVSFLLLRGKCRYCHEKISWRYPIVELITASVWTYLFYLLEFDPRFIFLAVLAWILIVATATDLDKQMIPDELIIIGLITGIIQAIYFKMPFLACVFGFLGPSTLLFILAVVTRGGVGGGDIKIAAVLGLFWGLVGGLFAILGGYVISGLVFIPLFLSNPAKTRKLKVSMAPFFMLGTIAWAIIIGLIPIL